MIRRHAFRPLRYTLTLLTLLLLATLSPARASAQIDSSSVGCAKCLWRAEIERKGVWKYTYDSSLGEPKIAVAEKALLQTTLTQLADIAHAAPVMTNLPGINATVWSRLDMGCPFNIRLCAWKQLGAWEDILVDMLLLNVKTGQRQTMNQESPRLHIAVNDPTELWFYGGHNTGLFDEHGYEIIPVLQQVGTVQGLPIYDNQLVVVASKPLFVPINREKYIKAIIDAFAAETKADSTNKPTGDYMIDLLQKELAAMPSAERATQAFGNGGLAGPTSGLAEPDAPGATPMFVFNPDYFDRTLPRTAVQLITVRTNEPTSETGPEIDASTADVRTQAVWELRFTINYEKLRGLLDPRLKVSK